MPDLRAYFHVTTRDGSPSILNDGLIPQLGLRSMGCGETVPAVYLFIDRLAADGAVCNWLGDALGDLRF